MTADGSPTPLLHVLSPAPRPQAGAPVLVLLHGRGADEHDLAGLRQILPGSWPLITPRAPFSGIPWGYGAGWAWYRYLHEDRIDEAAMAHSLSALDDLLGRLPEILGQEPGPVVLGGFSQGGTTSMTYALARPGQIAAVLNFSGFLPGHVDPAATADPPPMFWGHGLHDPAIPHRLAVSGRARLRAAGVSMTTGDYAIGHWIVPEEIEAAVRMVEDRLGDRARA